MLEFYKTVNNITQKIDQVEPGCWISAIAPTEEEKSFLIDHLGVMPEFVNASLDADESAHIDYDDDFDQTLVIFDYPSAEEDSENYKHSTLKYTTLPLGVVLTHEHIITICLYENYNINDMCNGTVKGVNTTQKTRFLLLLLLRISQRFLIYLRQIDRLSSFTEKKLRKLMKNQEIIQMLGFEKSLVYFNASLKNDEITLNKIMRGKIIKLYEEDEDLLEDVLIEVRQATEMCNIYSNTLSSTMDAYASIISNNLNNVMKALTVLTIVMEIPNIVFSYYGMNVSGLPFPFAWFPILFAFCVCGIAAFIFKKKDMF